MLHTPHIPIEGQTSYAVEGRSEFSSLPLQSRLIKGLSLYTGFRVPTPGASGVGRRRQAIFWTYALGACFPVSVRKSSPIVLEASGIHENLMKANKRIPINGGEGLTQSPFEKLDASGLPPGPQESATASNGSSPQLPQPARKNRGRVDIVREKAHRGGKTVTVIKGFVGIGLPEKESLAKAIQRAAGVGGTVKDGHIEIQGDNRDVAARVLTEAGFRPVFAGG